MRKVIFIFLLIACYYAKSNAQTDDTVEKLEKQFADSPRDSTRLSLLVKLAQITQHKPDMRKRYINTLISEAAYLESNKNLCYGYLYRIFMAYNVSNTKEVNYWMQKLEPLARKEKLYDILFQGKQCVTDLISMNEEYELLETEAKKIKDEAEELNNTLGKIIGRMSLAQVYRVTYRGKEAVQALEEAHAIIESMDQFAIHSELLLYTISIYLEMHDYKNALKYIQLNERTVLEYISKHPEQKDEATDNLMMAYLYYMRYYVVKGNIEMASKYKTLAEIHFSPHFVSLCLSSYYEGMYYYYQFTSDYENALKCTEEVLKMDQTKSRLNYSNFLHLKALALTKMGRTKEALAAYKECMKNKETRQMTILNRQMEYIKKAQNTDNLLLEKENIQNTIRKVVLGAIVFTILMVGFFFFRSLRIRNQLRHDETQMRSLAQKEEAANMAKDNFLAHICQYIHSPLNTIVEGSLRLASEEIPLKERTTISENINTLSSELMEVINDILLLSRIEAGMMKFNIEKVCIASTIRDTIMGIKSVSNINISFEDTLSFKYVTNIDIEKLAMIFRSVLLPIEPGREIKIKTALYVFASQAKINIENSLLSSSSPTQTIENKNLINKLIIEQSKGSYVIEGDSIQITLPVYVDQNV